ncbi:hypothetical protein BD769DRAFT_1387127 [Suillus cothurnatus]|nr:hypothetical protein BD769DRAFT_1387127 [Suillus cothurnatus]
MYWDSGHLLHRMERWDDISFYSITLKSTGICLQLGHASGVWCINPLSAHNDDFVIINYNSIYEAGQYWNSYTKGSLRGIVMHDMKHAGQCHHPDGIGVTKPGACTILCPACPHTGKNLPDGWENAPSKIHPRFLYALFLAINANFCLARRNVSLDIVDLGFNHGYAFFVRNMHIKISLVHTINLADLRVSHGLAATGTGTIDCTRYNFKQPCSVGDLQKGKRYLNMDYLFFSSMQSSSEISTLNISYDITCQWSKHLWTQMSTFPHQYHIKHD